MAILALVLAACSSTGGKRAAEAAAAGQTSVAAGHSNTPHYTIAMITHAAPGDTFWDIIRAGATAAAAKDNITLKYSSDPDPTKQAQLITDAINSKVNGIAVTDPAPAAICPTVKAARAAGIPVVMFNAGVNNWQQCGGMSFFGQDESIAGLAAGKRLASEGAKNVLCVLQAQGQVQLEARCAGVKAGLGSEGTMSKLYVNGEDNSAMLSSMTAELTRNKSIDAVITLGAPVALVAIQAIAAAHSTTKLYTFDTNAAEIAKIKSGASAVGRGPAAVPAGLSVGRLAVAVPDQRRRPGRRRDRADRPGLHRRQQCRPGGCLRSAGHPLRDCRAGTPPR